MNSLDISSLRHLSGPILITGHTGFKGTWLTLLLERLGVQVVGYSLKPTENCLFNGLNRTGQIIEDFSDLRDIEKLTNFINKTKPSLVFHLAAQPLVLDSYKDPRETFDVNLMGTVNLFEVCKNKNYIEAILTTTTDKVYWNKNTGHKFIESDPLMGKDPYSASKVATENAIVAYSSLITQSSSTKLVALRSGNVIGGGDVSLNRLIPDLVKAFSADRKAIIRSPNSTRPWQHALDPLLGYVMTANSILSGRNFGSINFGPSSDSLRVVDVADLAKTTWGGIASYEIEESPENLESKTLELNSNFARKELGWYPVWNQLDAVSDSIKWWKEVFNKRASKQEATDKDLDHLFANLKVI